MGRYDAAISEALESSVATSAVVPSRCGACFPVTRLGTAPFQRSMRRAASTLCDELVASRRDSQPAFTLGCAGNAHIYIEGDAARIPWISVERSPTHSEIASGVSVCDMDRATWRRTRRKKKRT